MKSKKTSKKQQNTGFKKVTLYKKYLVRDGYCRTYWDSPTYKRKRKTVDTAEGSEAIEYPVEILDEKQKKMVMFFSGGVLGGSRLGAFLCQHCNVQNPESMTWKQIIASLEVFAQKNGIGSEQIEQYPKKTWRSEKTDTDAVWSRPMSKTEMQRRLGIDGDKTFKKYAERIGILTLGRKTFQIRLDKLDEKAREKLEKP